MNIKFILFTLLASLCIGCGEEDLGGAHHNTSQLTENGCINGDIKISMNEGNEAVFYHCLNNTWKEFTEEDETEFVLQSPLSRITYNTNYNTITEIPEDEAFTHLSVKNASESLTFKCPNYYKFAQDPDQPNGTYTCVALNSSETPNTNECIQGDSYCDKDGKLVTCELNGDNIHKVTTDCNDDEVCVKKSGEAAKCDILNKEQTQDINISCNAHVLNIQYNGQTSELPCFDCQIDNNNVSCNLPSDKDISYCDNNNKIYDHSNSWNGTACSENPKCIMGPVSAGIGDALKYKATCADCIPGNIEEHDQTLNICNNKGESIQLSCPEGFEFVQSDNAEEPAYECQIIDGGCIPNTMTCNYQNNKLSIVTCDRQASKTEYDFSKYTIANDYNCTNGALVQILPEV